MVGTNEILLDTNILVRIIHRSSQDHHIARQAVEKLNSEGHQLLLVPQILFEYWVVITRPVKSNGLGLTASNAQLAINQWLKACPLLRDQPVVFDLWQALVSEHQVIGKNAHDARVVAAMQCHQIETLLTFNQSDFIRYEQMNILTPEMVVAGSAPTDIA